jgi:rSAM/selenodomain-associated transferase 2
MISVIVPVLNEEKRIRKTLERLKEMKGNFETIIVDGGSRDKTTEIAREFAPVIVSKKGRAIQMNTGSGRAKGDVLFFLHVDCIPEKEAFLEIERIMKDTNVVSGALCFDLGEDSVLYRNHVYWSNIRARIMGVYLGDHGIFVRRSVFDRVGGFPNLPLMEDVSLCKRLKKEGRFVQAKSRITASSRRLKEQGFFKSVFQMWANRLLFRFGVSPETLSKFYRDIR